MVLIFERETIMSIVYVHRILVGCKQVNKLLGRTAKYEQYSQYKRKNAMEYLSYQVVVKV